jgi:hypothetical protein
METTIRWLLWNTLYKTLIYPVLPHTTYSVERARRLTDHTTKDWKIRRDKETSKKVFLKRETLEKTE